MALSQVEWVTKKIKLLLIRNTVHSSSSRGAVNTSVDRRCKPLLSDRGPVCVKIKLAYEIT